MSTGGLLEVLAYYKNLYWFSNASALWLGLDPPDIFFYVLLPPLLLDAAVRLDWCVAVCNPNQPRSAVRQE
jgi:hypothetical protein